MRLQLPSLNAIWWILETIFRNVICFYQCVSTYSMFGPTSWIFMMNININAHPTPADASSNHSLQQLFFTKAMHAWARDYCVQPRDYCMQAIIIVLQHVFFPMQVAFFTRASDHDFQPFSCKLHALSACSPCCKQRAYVKWGCKEYIHDIRFALLPSVQGEP